MVNRPEEANTNISENRLIINASVPGRKGIRPVKTEWWSAGVVVSLKRGADLPS